MSLTSDYLNAKQGGSSKSTTGSNSLTTAYLQNVKKRKKDEDDIFSSGDIAPVYSAKAAWEKDEKDDLAPIVASEKTEKDDNDIGKWLFNSFFSGLSSFNKSVTKTADIILGKPLEALGWEDNPVSKMADYYEETNKHFQERARKYSGEGTGWDVATSLIEGASGAAPTAALALMTGGASLGTTTSGLTTQAAAASGGILAKAGLTTQTMTKNPQFWLSFAQSYGEEYEQARANGASDTKAALSATISSLINSGIEIGPDGMSGIQGIPEKVKKGGGKAVAEWAKSALEEGEEEALQRFVNELVSVAVYQSEEDILNPVEYAKDFAMGTAVGGVLGGGMIGVQKGAEAIQGHNAEQFTENEKKVVDLEVQKRIAEREQAGTPVGPKAKKDIEEQVKAELEKGYISIDTIEEALGGETYQNYRNTADSLDALQAEFDSLYKMKQGDMTGEQIDKRDSLKQYLQEVKDSDLRNRLKSQLSEEVSGLANGSRLAESYNERSRRGQAFEADLNKYDEKQRATIQKAIDSGILNNTNRTHEFVDLVAKISADKGVLFDFTDNAKLKESGFAVEGKQVNGFVTKDGITLNIDSPKALQTTVGHEITHVLEGTEVYAELQNILFEHAKTKGEFDSRRSSLAELYKDIQDADIDGELTADLVGEYLFTDTEFIKKLSVEHRNVFQKIYDEIKYLYKVATAGGKEAREIEKVKKAFEEAYRADGKGLGATKYSIADSTGKELTAEQQDYFKDSKVRDENGNLKVMYHGSQDAGFHVFDTRFSDDDTSFFFVDRNDAAATYSGTTETYAPVSFRSANDANKFFSDNGLGEYEVIEKDGKYTLLDDGDEVATSDSLDTIYEEFRDWSGLGYGEANYKAYLNLTNPLEVDAEGRNWNRIGGEFSQEVYNRYQSLTAEEKAALTDLAGWEDAGVFRDELQTAVESVERGASYVDDYTRTLASAAEKLGDVDQYRLFDIAADSFSEESLRENAVKYLTTRDYAQKAREQGHDGVIFKNIVDLGGYSNGSEGAATVAIAFDSKQIKSVANTKPTDNPDIRYSLSKQGESPVNNRLTTGKDIALEVAPVKETVAESTMFPDDLGPIADDSERFASLSDADVPPEVEAPYTESEPVTVDDPLADRTYEEVGKRSVKAYMYENPEVKPFFQTEAEVMLNELRNSVKGERFFNSQLHYDTNYEEGWTGTKRLTSDDVAYMLDHGYTYAEIEKGLKAIIEDHGAENNACSKRLEFILNDRLKDGYTDFQTGYEIPPNPDYINLLNEKQINEYSKEAFDAFMQTADQYAPPVVEPPIAPAAETKVAAAEVAPTLEEVKVKGKGEVVGQKVMPGVKPEAPKDGKTAQIVENANILPREERKKGMMFATKFVDKGQAVEELSHETGNHALQDKYEAARPSKAKASADWLMKHGSKKNGVKSLEAIFKQVGEHEEAFNDYLYHRHNIDRMTLDERFHKENLAVYGDSVTADISRETVEQLESLHPDFPKFAEDVYKYNRHLRQMAVDGGLISQGLANLWEKYYPHYVPIHRIDEAGISVNVPLDTNKTGVNSPFKRAKGGNSNFQTARATMAERTIQTYKAIARNRFGVELKNTLKSTLKQDAATLNEVIDSIDAHEELLKKGANGMNPTFTVFENGERVEFEITEDLFDALKPDDPFWGQTIKPINAVSNVRRNMLTSWNPVFALFRNPAKDMQEVFLNSQHAMRTYANVFPAIKQLAHKSKNYGKYATEFFENGGRQLDYFDQDTKKFNDHKNIVKTLSGIGAIERAGEFIETIPRLAEFMASRKMGRSVEQSMLDAARVTTNFGAGGEVTKFANRHGFNFLNASVQGTAQHIRNFREAKQHGLGETVKLISKYALTGVVPLIFNDLMWGDDEEYEELNDYVKDRYYILFKTQDGKFIRLPKGRTAAVVEECMEQMRNKITGNDEADFNEFFKMFMDNIAPANPLDSNILAPLLQTLNNKTWYGEDLVPSRLAKLPKEEQFDESTDAISRWLGEKTGFSPVKINYLLDQYSGGLGDTFLPMITPEAENGADTFGGKLIAPWKKELTTDSVLNNKYPGEFYSLRDEMEVNANAKGATDNDALRNMYLEDVGWDMSDLYAEKREIQSSNMTDSEKYEAIREVQEEINAIAENALNNYKGVYIDGLYAEVGDRRFDKNEANGKWYKIDPDYDPNGFYEREQKAVNAFGVSYSDYWNNRAVYDDAVSYAKRYQKDITKTVRHVFGAYEFGTWAADMKEINAKDENGKTVNGLKKERMYDYIFGLDADYGEKAILFKSEYPKEDSFNRDIVDYLNSRDDISYSEMEAILVELGAEVDSEGYITWK